jgi:hypothetical protein
MDLADHQTAIVEYAGGFSSRPPNSNVAPGRAALVLSAPRAR